MHMTKKLAKVLGVIFILVGVLAFFSNPLVGSTGFFIGNTAHKLLHIVLGLILVMCGTEAKAALWLKIVGALYFLVAILGFVMMKGAMTISLFGVMVNGADNWLHLGLGLVTFLSGFAGSAQRVDDTV